MPPPGCPEPLPPLSLLVSLQTVYEVHQCGATLVAPDWALTAAQCTNPAPVHAKFGLVDLSTDVEDGDRCVRSRRVTAVVRHPGFNWRTLENDLALVRLAPLSRTELAAAPLPLVRLVASAGSPPELAAPEYVSAGWGAEGYISGASSDLSATAHLVPARTASCNFTYDNKLRGAMRCAWAGSAKEACRIDTGGALLEPSGDTMLLAGVASWGRGCRTHGKLPSVKIFKNRLGAIATPLPY